MKGYFSRLAKQSGLRFPGQNTVTHSFSAGQPEADLSPLHREKTIMISPSLPAERVTGAPGSKAPGETGASEKLPSPARAEQNQKQARRVSGSGEALARTEEKFSVEPGRKEKRVVSPPENTDKNSPPAFAKKGFDADEPAGEIQVVEQIVFTGSDKPAENEPEKTAEAAGPGELITHEILRPESAESAGQRKYFSKTAELLQKGEPDAVEIQNILFQEVREWVAGEPVTTELPGPQPERRSETIAAEESFTRVREPGVITVTEKNRIESIETAGLEEQSFNLSIGTISVVIEAEETPKQPEQRPQNENNQNVSRKTKREFSRLNRNYL